MMPCKLRRAARSPSGVVHAVPHTILLASLATAAKRPKEVQPQFTQRVENPDSGNFEVSTHEEDQAAAAASSSSTAIAESVNQLPGCSTFERMYARLEDWSSTYHTSHVPHHVFDAADLGAWVRDLRHQQQRGTLEQWKVDQLNRLGFQWLISKEDAKWHANVHHLRQFRVLHGPATPPYSDGQHGAWRELAAWIQEQGKLLTSGRLPLVKIQILEAVGVTLSVDPGVAARHVKLQGLNGHERRLIRKRWKAQDAAQAERAVRAAEQLQLASRALMLQREQEKQRRERVRSIIYPGDFNADAYALPDPSHDIEAVLHEQDRDEGGYLSMPATPGHAPSSVEYDIDW